MKKILVIVAAVILGACAPISEIIHSNGLSEYDYVGCQQVTDNPDKNGSVAFGPFGLYTPVTFLQQVSEDGSVTVRSENDCNFNVLDWIE